MTPINVRRLTAAGILVATFGATSLVRGQSATGAAAPTPPVQQAEQRTGTCIAIVLPTVSGVEGNAADVAAALRELFSSYLSGPSMQIMPLDARLTSQAAEEARQKQCDRLLLATLTKKRSGGGLLGVVLGQAAGTAAYYVPFGDGVAGAVARGVTVAGAQAVTTLASATKAKDEMRLDYQLSSSDASARFGPKTDKAKASQDGEDLLTPMVKRAAEAIVSAVGQK